MYENFKDFGLLLEAFFAIRGHDIFIPASDAAEIMGLLKLARRMNASVYHEDSYVDGAGYTAIAAQCRAQEELSNV